jgi:hypothetical protein
MKKAKQGKTWFFVDESGDPTFYDKRGNYIVGQENGASPLLILGFIETQNPTAIRRAVLDLQQEIANDPYFQGFPSIQKTAIAFHAKDDRPEIRYRFFKLLASLDFCAQFVVARKTERVFRNRFKAREMAFYDYLVSCLFQDVMHRHQHNTIYFAKRGSKVRQAPLREAIQTGILRFEAKLNKTVDTTFEVLAQQPGREPCLSVSDYMLWAVQRAFTRGEMQYYRTVEEKVSFLVDIYDEERRPHNKYSRKYPFDIKKTTPL